MIIYNSIAEEIKRKCQSKTECVSFINDLFSLYSPKDKNSNGENLLTIFLNQYHDKGIDGDILNEFITKKFKIQINKIKSYHLNALINEMIISNQLKELPKLLSEKDDWFYLKIPTIYIKELMDCFHKPKTLLYNDTDCILHYWFNDTMFFENKQVLTSYLNDARQILINLFINKNLSKDYLDFLTTDKFEYQLYCCIERRFNDFQSEIDIQKIFANHYKKNQDIIEPHGFNSRTYLATLRSDIFSKMLDSELSNKSNAIHKTNKI